MTLNYVAWREPLGPRYHFFEDLLADERGSARALAIRHNGSVWRRPSWDGAWDTIAQIGGPGPIEAADARVLDAADLDELLAPKSDDPSKPLAERSDHAARARLLNSSPPRAVHPSEMP